MTEYNYSDESPWWQALGDAFVGFAGLMMGIFILFYALSTLLMKVTDEQNKVTNEMKKKLNMIIERSVIKDNILFGSGSHSLKPYAYYEIRIALEKLRKNYQKKTNEFINQKEAPPTIRYLVIIGHTDSDPIGRSKKNAKDNWDLSTRRARAIADFLSNSEYGREILRQNGFQEVNIMIAGRSYFEPHIDNIKSFLKNDRKYNKYVWWYKEKYVKTNLMSEEDYLKREPVFIWEFLYNNYTNEALLDRIEDFANNTKRKMEKNRRIEFAIEM